MLRGAATRIRRRNPLAQSVRVDIDGFVVYSIWAENGVWACFKKNCSIGQDIKILHKFLNFQPLIFPDNSWIIRLQEFDTLIGSMLISACIVFNIARPGTFRD